MDFGTKEMLIKAGRPELVEIAEINASGYAGVLPHGYIVDRRVFPHAVPVPANQMLGIPESKDLPEKKPFYIWCEGYRATGEHGIASCLNPDNPIMAYSFEGAIAVYINTVADCKIEKYEPKNFGDAQSYLNRRAKYHIWMCALFDNEADARKAFG